ncbi:cyclin-dependent kinase inhibitor 1C-like [Capsicum annuum]|uniref:cyclin-dependent kinase inhibitor 1C-like n=1 Tax=Capsicum annuum TaxID=4072 RepID=UPI001FB17A90|nr:cyclin-dependent kinase inhibitor 1C-like [Capsicum annuum]
MSPAPSPSPTYGADPTVGHRRTLSLSLFRAPVSGPVAVVDLQRRPDRRSPTPTPGPDRRSPTPTPVAEHRFPPAVPPHPTPFSVQTPFFSGAVTTVQQPKLDLQPQPPLHRQQPQIHLSSDPPAAGRRGAWLPTWSTSEIW